MLRRIAVAEIERHLAVQRSRARHHQPILQIRRAAQHVQRDEAGFADRQVALYRQRAYLLRCGGTGGNCRCDPSNWTIPGATLPPSITTTPSVVMARPLPRMRPRGPRR